MSVTIPNRCSTTSFITAFCLKQTWKGNPLVSRRTSTGQGSRNMLLTKWVDHNKIKDMENKPSSLDIDQEGRIVRSCSPCSSSSRCREKKKREFTIVHISWFLISFDGLKSCCEETTSYKSNIAWFTGFVGERSQIVFCDVHIRYLDYIHHTPNVDKCLVSLAFSPPSTLAALEGAIRVLKAFTEKVPALWRFPKSWGVPQIIHL